MRPYVKICGLKRVADAELSVALGATHVGCVRAPSSPRRASLDEVRAIFERVGDRAERVLVFKGVPAADVLEEARHAGAGAVQLYEFAEDDARALEGEGLRVYRVFRLERHSERLPELVPRPTEEHPALLDVGGGGSGQRFDWTILGDDAPSCTFIAGGIGAENVGELLRHHPYGLDLSSRVESAPGVKDEAKLRRFFERVDRAAQESSS